MYNTPEVSIKMYEFRKSLWDRSYSVGDHYVASALKISATRETAHPDDREGWTPDNPTYGQCDLFTEINKQIWARTVSGTPKWEQQARKLVWWAYASHEAFLTGLKKHKLTVHWSLLPPVYGEIDFAREQFPDGTYLHPRPKPLSHEVPVDRSWRPSSEIPIRLSLIWPAFTSALSSLSQPSTLSPQLESFFERIAKGESIRYSEE